MESEDKGPAEEEGRIDGEGAGWVICVSERTIASHLVKG